MDAERNTTLAKFIRNQAGLEDARPHKLGPGCVQLNTEEALLCAEALERATDDKGPWQPIETAPRDGTPVDLWHKVGTRMTEIWWDADDRCWSNCFDDSDYTHWMPVPPAPYAKAPLGAGTANAGAEAT